MTIPRPRASFSTVAKVAVGDCESVVGDGPLGRALRLRGVCERRSFGGGARPSSVARTTLMHWLMSSAKRPALWIRLLRSFRSARMSRRLVAWLPLRSGGTLARTCLSIVAIGVSAVKGGRPSIIS